MSATPYAQAVAYLYNLQRHGIKLGLDTIRALLGAVNRPHERYPTLHIGGTNGKGSTAALAAVMLQSAGYRVGLYTSPHLVDFRERITVNGEPIPEDILVEATAHLRAVCPREVSPTFFEFTTAIALWYFAQCQVDVAVLEVGLGGRFDATNVVAPLVSCITTIALDHQEYLGSTISAIAFEKAGIIKSRVPAVVGRVGAEAMAVISAVARERGAPLRVLGTDFRTEGQEPADCSYHGPEGEIRSLSCPLLGRHQLDNLACALAMMDVIRPRGLFVDEEAVRRGVMSVRWAGRLETVGERPRMVLDGAHNPAAARVLAEYLHAFKRGAPRARVIVVVGMMRDKDHAGVLNSLVAVADDVVLTKPKLARAAELSQLAASLMPLPHGPRVHQVPDVGAAIRQAQSLAGAEDLVLITGSLMLVGEAKAFLRGLPMSPLRG